MSKPASHDQTDRERLHEKFAQLGLRGYWQNRRDHLRMEPKLWRWEEIYPVLMETTEVIRIGPAPFAATLACRPVARHCLWGFRLCFPAKQPRPIATPTPPYALL